MVNLNDNNCTGVSDDNRESVAINGASVKCETRANFPSKSGSEIHVSLNGAHEHEHSIKRSDFGEKTYTDIILINRERNSLNLDESATNRIKERESSVDSYFKEADATERLVGQERLVENSDTDGDVNEVNKDTDEDNKNLPIDRGWAWVILIASVLMHFIIIGQLKCFGILFVQFQRRFGSGSSETSIIYTMMNAAYSVTALLILTVGSSVPTRTCLTIGTIIMCIGSAITGIIHDVRIAFITAGAATGVASAFAMPQISTTISEYFVKRRGFANNFMNVGVSLGGIALAPILTKLFETYGFTGTYILITGLNLQLFVITCLIRPVSFYRKLYRKVLRETVSNGEEGQKLVSANRNSNKSDENMCAKQSDNAIHEGNTKHFVTNNKPKAMLLKQWSVHGDVRRRRYFSESDSVRSNGSLTKNTHQPIYNGRFASTDFLNSSLMDLTLLRESDDDKFNNKALEYESSDLKETETCKIALRRLISKLFDFKLLSNPVFQYYLVVNALLCTGCSMAIAYLPTHAIESGVSEDMAALLVSVPSILDILSKIIFGFLSDKGWCHRSTLIAITCFVLGIVALFVHFMTSFGTMLIYAVVAGLFQGVYFALFVVVIIDILGMENLKGALGFISLVQGVTGGACLPVAGYLRDYSGSYNYTFTFIGSLLISGAILCYFVPNVHTWHLNKLKQKDEQRTRV
ncbi:hypothetical protein ACF0H5_020708 [Mactra antiquata]